MSCYQPPGCIPDFPINVIAQAVNDALAERMEEMQGYTTSASISAAGAAASASYAYDYMEQTKDYRDQTQVIFNSAQELVPRIVQTAADVQETAELIERISQNASSYQIVNYYYTTVGGESQIVIPTKYDALTVQAIYIEGTRQDAGYGYFYDATNRTITLAEPIPQDAAGTLLTIQLGQTNVDSPETVLSALASPNGAGLVSTSSGESVEDVLVNTESNIRELWRRDLLDIGLTLVSGSFEQGTSVNNTTEAVWFKSANQCYVWMGSYPKTVPINSTPESAGGISASGWVSVADQVLSSLLRNSDGSMLGYKFNTSTQQQTVKERFDAEPLYLSSFCTAPYKTADNAVAIQSAINLALELHKPLIIDGEFYSSKELKVILPPTLDTTFSFVLKGYGRSSSMLRFPSGVRGLILTSDAGQYADIVYGAKLTGFSVQCDEYDITNAPVPSTSEFTVGIYHQVGLGQCEFNDLGIKGFDYGFRGENTLFLSRIISCNQLQCYNGLYMSNRGTSNQIDQNYVYGSRGTAYRLTGAYSSFGSLACDRSEGDIYNFSYFSGFIGSLGYESYAKGTVGKIFRASLSYMSVGHFYAQDLQGKATDSSVIIETNASRVSFDTVDIVDSNSANTPAEGLVGIGINNINSWISIGRLITPYKLRTGNPTWSDALNNSFTEIDGVKFANKWGKGFLGSLTDDVANATSGSSVITPLVLFDMFGGAKFSGANGEKTMTYGPGIRVGQLGVERRPDLHGVAGYACLSDGTDNNNKVLAPILMGYRGSSPPANPVVGSVWINSTNNKIYHFAGVNWYDAMGTVRT